MKSFHHKFTQVTFRSTYAHDFSPCGFMTHWKNRLSSLHVFQKMRLFPFYFFPIPYPSVWTIPDKISLTVYKSILTEFSSDVQTSTVSFSDPRWSAKFLQKISQTMCKVLLDTDNEIVGSSFDWSFTIFHLWRDCSFDCLKATVFVKPGKLLYVIEGVFAPSSFTVI